MTGPLGWVPRRWLYALGRGLGWLLWTLRVRRRVVLDNLRLAFPEKAEAERLGIARGTYRHLGQMAVEFLMAPRMSREELDQVLVYDGLERIEAARALGKGVVCCTAHFGNWELLQAGSALRGIPLTSITRASASNPLDRLLQRVRARSGLREIGVKKGETLKAALRALRQNHVLGYVIDQNVSRRRAVFPTFFGVPAATAPTPAWFAMRHGAAVVFALAEPAGEGRYRVVIEGPLRPPDTGDRDRDTLAFLQDLNDRLERAVRRHPDHWYWLHRRWKTRPDSSD